MIKSMTAFAKASCTRDALTVDLTVRSYNSRYLDFSVYLPESCQPFEEDIKRIMGQYHSRGRIEIRMNLTDQSEDQDLFEVDKVKARAYYKALKTVQETLSLPTDIPLETVLGARQVITAAKPEVDETLLKSVVCEAVEAAAKDLDRMRKQEGENLRKDLSGRLDWIEEQMKEIRTQADSVPKTYKARLEERLAALTADADAIDPVRLAQEVAVLADKSDVSEEIVRIHSHLQLFREIMDAQDSQGRKLNFLIQEFNREFNTIGSKAGNAQLSHGVVDLKSELEKIREQVQNIE
ncbi:MAG TPA: YicC family protein [Desulfobacteraceae bacterium]|nr:YicC family protein [Desulfobacteraceae bacterium]|tara:strand:+ start:253 stop:1134 length:882 start_codon:yes stop_codon:yes gene_type:complete